MKHHENPHLINFTHDSLRGALQNLFLYTKRKTNKA
jgi:hypothetical protein